jgi:predicted O-methyltransferase YrrM
MIDIRRLLERTAFHIPYSHDWLAERDALRIENHSLHSKLQQLNADLERTQADLQATQAQLAQMISLFQPPGHFYSPIPDIAELKSNYYQVFTFPESIPDVDLNVARQFELLDQFRDWYSEQPFSRTKIPGRRYYFDNVNFSYTDAIVLYCMMRYLKPKKIVEVGSGFSSAAMLDVNDVLFDGQIDLTFIDPYPGLLLDLLKETDTSSTRVLGERVQDVDLDVFRRLEANDILFIDSSHVSKTGSDLNHLVFRVLPVLQDGVYVHFHDIFYPFEYPPEWALEGRAWNEVYLLHAFLAHNPAYHIEFFNTFLIHNYRDRIAAEFPLFLKSVGGSLWVRKGASE